MMMKPFGMSGAYSMTVLTPNVCRTTIGADSLAYVSEEGLIEATNVQAEKLCTACFSGKYPIAIPTDMSEGKMRLELTDVHTEKVHK